MGVGGHKAAPWAGGWAQEFPRTGSAPAAEHSRVTPPLGPSRGLPPRGVCPPAPSPCPLGRCLALPRGSGRDGLSPLLRLPPPSCGPQPAKRGCPHGPQVVCLVSSGSWRPPERGSECSIPSPQPKLGCTGSSGLCMQPWAANPAVTADFKTILGDRSPAHSQGGLWAHEALALQRLRPPSPGEELPTMPLQRPCISSSPAPPGPARRAGRAWRRVVGYRNRELGGCHPLPALELRPVCPAARGSRGWWGCAADECACAPPGPWSHAFPPPPARLEVQPAGPSPQSATGGPTTLPLAHRPHACLPLHLRAPSPCRPSVNAFSSTIDSKSAC